MSDPDNTPTGGKQDWEGFREVDRAIAENRLTSYTCLLYTSDAADE